MTARVSSPIGVLLLATLLCAGAARGRSEPTLVAPAVTRITLESLLEEMTDRTAVARLPVPAYRVRQASSYDRGSARPGAPGWFANADWSNFVRRDEREGRIEWVLMDEAGPGAVVRIWVTGAHFDRTIRVYLDGADAPVIEGPLADVIGGGRLAWPPLSAERSRGRNLYLPIPYRERCTITVDGPNARETGDFKDNLYYQVNYRTYADGVDVETLKPARLAALRARIDDAGRRLLIDDPSPDAEAVTLTDGPRLLEPGATFALEMPGAAAITMLGVLVDADDPVQALRSTILRITFDGETTVWCPVGDFFGSGVGVNPFRGRYRGVREGGLMYCTWVMPYERECRLEIVNAGREPVSARLALMATAPWDWDERSLHFHATWRQQREIETKAGAGTMDWNYVDIVGRGLYVGDTLVLLNRASAWWGEGDEKVYVDGEPFPSHFGTGTEDYYGYAWGNATPFAAPFHAQPRAEGPGSFGHVTNTRTRALDAIPFERSLRFDMEVWHWAATRVDYAATTYWYAPPGATSNRAPEPEEAAAVVSRDAPAPPAGGFTVLGKTGGVVRTQDLRSFATGLWTDDDHLWWTDARPGDRLEIALPVERAGRYDIVVVLTRAIDYGIVRFRLDDEPIGPPLDGYHDGVVRSAPITLGTRDLGAGPHRLSVEITGANENAVESYMFGLDEVILRPAR